MKIHPAQQGSQEWLEARCGIPTASEFDALLTPEFAPRKGEMPKTYLARKLAEWWGGPLPGFGTWATEQGQILEEEAFGMCRMEFGDVQRIGLCLTDDERVGASPDGLIGEDGGLEIKCPEAPTHVKYLMADSLPKDYATQVHGSLYVTGRKWWKFVSYRRRFPPLIVHVERDETIISKIDECLQSFLVDFETEKEWLIARNGRPPPKRVPMIFSDESPRYVSETPS